MKKGWRMRSWHLIDAACSLMLPNYSLQVNLTVIGLLLSLLLLPIVKVFTVAFITLLAGQIVLFSVGACIAGSPFKIIRASLYAPVFLVWKAVIDMLTFTGLYREKRWIRTRRHMSNSNEET